MTIKPKGTVTMPRTARRGLDILPWAEDVNRALQQLRDRVFDVPSHTPRAGTSSLAGAFWTQYTDEAGDTYLQGGSVTGGNGGSATIADAKVLDADDGPWHGEATVTAGSILYAEVTCNATVDSGIMLPGCEVTAAAFGAHASAVPDNEAFTAAAPTGKKIYLEIGRWTDAAFLPAGPPGNLLAGGCIGNFSISKVG